MSKYRRTTNGDNYSISINFFHSRSFKIKELKEKHLSSNERCYFLSAKQLNRD